MSATHARKIFVNLAVRDLKKSMGFLRLFDAAHDQATERRRDVAA
jgi:predicted lactoylglutathione lyase